MNSQNKENTSKLYRFTDILNLMDMIERKKLVLVNHRLWEDTHENFIFNKVSQSEENFNKFKDLTLHVIYKTPTNEKYLISDFINLVKKMDSKDLNIILNKMLNIIKYFFVSNNISNEISKLEEDDPYTKSYKSYLEDLKKYTEIREQSKNDGTFNNYNELTTLGGYMLELLSLQNIEHIKNLYYKYIKIGWSKLIEKIDIFLKSLKISKLDDILKSDDNTRTISILIDDLLNPNIINIKELIDKKKNEKQIAYIMKDIFSEDQLKTIYELSNIDTDFLEMVYNNVPYLYINFKILKTISELIKIGYENNSIAMFKNLLKDKFNKSDLECELTTVYFMFMLENYIMKLSESIHLKYGFFGQSWTKHQESDALWRIYSNNNNASVKIAINYEKEMFLFSLRKKYNIHLLEMIYDDEFFSLDKLFDTCKLNDNFYGAFVDSMIKKRKAFEHENECRLYAIKVTTQKLLTKNHFKTMFSVEDWDLSWSFFKKLDEEYEKTNSPILELDINPNDFIESVTVNPLAKDYMKKTIEAYIENYNKKLYLVPKANSNQLFVETRKEINILKSDLYQL